MDVSVVLVNYNTLELTSACIESIVGHTFDLSYEILVVDNASTDGSKSFFEKDLRIKYIYVDKNLGFGKANNLALRYAQGRNILFLNTDTVLRNNAVKTLSIFLDSNPQVGACGGNLFNAKGDPAYSYCKWFPSIKDQVDCLFHRVFSRWLYHGSFCFNNTSKPKEVAYVTGADLMVPRKILDECGAFDPHFFLYFEETELCHRIKTNGYKRFSVPEAEIFHFEGSSINSAGKTKRQYYSASREIYFSLTGRCRFYSKVVAFLATYCK